MKKPKDYLKLILEELKKQTTILETSKMVEMMEDAGIVKEMDLFKLEMKLHMTPRYLFEECKKLFPIWIYDESQLDKITSKRNGNYTIYFKKNIEADQENANMSANDLKKRGKQEITLEERLLMEIQYFKETGKHLDINNITLCAGSRYSDGYIPYVCWDADNRKVFVYWSNLDIHNSHLRARSAVKIEK